MAIAKSLALGRATDATLHRLSASRIIIIVIIIVVVVVTLKNSQQWNKALAALVRVCNEIKICI